MAVAIDSKCISYWYIAAPDVRDGTSAVGESRHRILKAHPLVKKAERVAREAGLKAKGK
jgi:hypothetical protein